jgi:tRNA threonylcarbamoyladenosine biosynthesis protein TsaB
VDPVILAIDTAHERGSIALVSPGGVIEEAPILAPDGFSQLLFGEIESLLARHRLPIERIAAFAAGRGPGSFTGLRVGLAAAKGLAEATGKPAFGLSNLAALASFGTLPKRAPFFDARRGDVYAATPDGEERVLPFRDFLSLLPPGAQLIGFDFDAFPAGGHPHLLVPRELAAAVGALAPTRPRWTPTTFAARTRS